MDVAMQVGAPVLELCVAFHKLVDRADAANALLEIMPPWLKDLSHHVVHQVLLEVKHTLTEAERATERRPQLELLGSLVVEPCFGEPPLHILAEEEMAEEQLVLGDHLHTQYKRPRSKWKGKDLLHLWHLVFFCSPCVTRREKEEMPHGTRV